MYNMAINTPYNQQQNLERVNEQIKQLESIRNQMQLPAQPSPINLTQNFPVTSNGMKYANSFEDVSREIVIGDTPYFSRDMSIVWIKNSKGEIKTYEMTEIIPKDDKDLQIEMLQEQVNELRGMIKNEPIITNDIQPKDESITTGDNETTRTATKESKSTSVSRVSTSKKK